MSQLARIQKFVEDQGRKLVDPVRTRLDELVDKHVPEAVKKPLSTDEGLSLKALREAATAAGDEIVTRVRELRLIKGGKKEEAVEATPEAVVAPEVVEPAEAPAPAKKKAPAQKTAEQATEA